MANAYKADKDMLTWRYNGWRPGDRESLEQAIKPTD